MQQRAIASRSSVYFEIGVDWAKHFAECGRYLGRKLNQPRFTVLICAFHFDEADREGSQPGHGSPTVRYMLSSKFAAVP